MIEINETKPVEASLTIVLRGSDITHFKIMMNELAGEYVLAAAMWEVINS